MGDEAQFQRDSRSATFRFGCPGFAGPDQHANMIRRQYMGTSFMVADLCIIVFRNRATSPIFIANFLLSIAKRSHMHMVQIASHIT